MKRVILFLFTILITISGFSEKTDIYNKIFYKPGLHMELYTDSMFLTFEYTYIGKYSYMDSNELLRYVWTQDKTLIGGQMYVESNYYTHAISSSHAIGLLQLKPIVAEDFGAHNLFNPIDNITTASLYHDYLNKTLGTEKKQIAGYYQGPTSVLKNGINSAGSYYYNKVKKAQKKYKNTSVYSPYLISISGNVKKNYMNLIANEGFAYKNWEFYSNQHFEVTTENKFEFNNLEVKFGGFYFPKTNFSIGAFSDYNLNMDTIARIGYPWAQNVVSFNNNNKILKQIYMSYDFKNNMWMKFYIDKDFLFITGISIYDIKLGILFNSSYRIGIFMSL